VKDFSNATTTQINDFKDEKVTQIKDFRDAKVTQIRTFTDPQVEKIREFVDPKVEKIKVAVEPRIERVSAVIKARKQKAQKLLRVPGSWDLKGLKAEGATLLGKVAASLEKAEVMVDKYLPLTEEQKQDCDGSDISSISTRSADSTGSDRSTVRITRSLVSIKARLLFALTIKIRMLLTLPLVFKTTCMEAKAACSDGTAKEKGLKYIEDKKLMLITAKKKGLKYIEDKKIMLTSKFGSAKATGLEKLESYKSLGLSYFHYYKAEGIAFLDTWKGKITDYIDAKISDKMKEQIKGKIDAVVEKIAPKAKALAQTSMFKKSLQVAVDTSEKILGKEKTAAILSKIQALIPSSFKED
jgi:hypothetical protein